MSEDLSQKVVLMKQFGKRWYKAGAGRVFPSGEGVSCWPRPGGAISGKFYIFPAEAGKSEAAMTQVAHQTTFTQDVVVKKKEQKKKNGKWYQIGSGEVFDSFTGIKCEMETARIIKSPFCVFLEEEKSDRFAP